MTQEKPIGNPVKFKDIELSSDVSLFKWIYRDGLKQLGLGEPQPGRCWLYTDDGSGEVADFILFDLRVQKISIFHAKGANSRSVKRKPSPGAFELVCAQAMKNLRRIQAGKLIDELSDRLSRNGNSRVWDKPWIEASKSSSTASLDFQQELEKIKKSPMKFEHEVIIVQPHLLKSQYKVNRNRKWPMPMQQLRALLFGVATMAHGASSTLKVVCDKR